MAKHDFNFIGGDQLRHIGASWFVSYCFYLNLDKTHSNWQLVKTASSRKSLYDKTKKFHRDWLTQIATMSENNLLRNKIKLSPCCTKIMASALLQKTTLK